MYCYVRTNRERSKEWFGSAGYSFVTLGYARQYVGNYIASENNVNRIGLPLRDHVSITYQL